jgi:HEAT repeat protein
VLIAALVIGALVLLVGGLAVAMLAARARQSGPPVVRITGDAALDKLLAEMGDRNPAVFQAAAEKLAAMQPNEHRAVVAQKLAERANVQDVFVRRAAVKALATWATPSEVPALIGALRDEDPFTRQEALKGIGPFRDERAVDLVVRCLREAVTRDDAVRAVLAMGSMAEKPILALLDQDDLFLRQAVVKLLADIGTRQSVPALEALAAQGGRDGLAKRAREALQAIADRGH